MTNNVSHKSKKGKVHKGLAEKCKLCFKARFGTGGSFGFDIGQGGKM